MTIRYAIRETETHPGKFPAGLDTSVEEVYEAQGEKFHQPPKLWIFAVTSPYSGEPPKVAAYRTLEGARRAMKADVEETVRCDDPKFDPDDLVEEDDDHARLGDEILWSVEEAPLLD